MKKIILFIIIWQLLTLLSAFDEEIRTESLAKIKNLNRLTKEHISEQVKAMEYANEAIKLAIEINDKYGEAKALRNIGLIHYYQSLK